MGASDLNPGDMLMGKYRVEKRLGAGAMGVVYAAMNDHLGQRVAIKVLKPSAAAGEAKVRFLREARASVKLKTEHVARVLDVGTTDDGAPYMIMEHLDGRDLADELQARGQLPIEEAVEYMLQVCEAVAEAHAAGIVHRDIKPANLFLTTGTGGVPRVKVLDFGISKVADDVGLTGSMALGSPLYMSPEHMQQSASVDARADIWALGVTLYELVAGKAPFLADQLAVVCALVFQQPPTPLSRYRTDAPPGFEAVIGTCLEKDRARRFPNVAALAAALVPYGPPRAALYAERAALALGEQVAMSRPTVALPPEPAAVRVEQAVSPATARAPMASAPMASSASITGSPAVTASPTVTSAQPAPAPGRAPVGIIAAVVGAVAVGGVLGAIVMGRANRAEQSPGTSAGTTTAKAATEAADAPPKVSSATLSALPNAGPSVEPATSATTAGSATAGAPRATQPASSPPSSKPGTLPRQTPAPAQPQQPAKAKRNIYDQ